MPNSTRHFAKLNRCPESGIQVVLSYGQATASQSESGNFLDSNYRCRCDALDPSFQTCKMSSCLVREPRTQVAPKARAIIFPGAAHRCH
jgi:hypothetical protein